MQTLLGRWKATRPDHRRLEGSLTMMMMVVVTRVMRIDDDDDIDDVYDRIHGMIRIRAWMVVLLVIVLMVIFMILAAFPYYISQTFLPPNNIWGQDVWVQRGSLGRQRLQEPTRPMNCNEIPHSSGYLNIYVYRSIIG